MRYGGSFTFSGDYQESDSRRCATGIVTQICAMDATPVFNLPNSSAQFLAINSVRDLNKAYCAFSRIPEDKPDVPLPPVATGNWYSFFLKGSDLF